MTQTSDAALIAMLESQYRELEYAAVRLQVARRTLVPDYFTVWRGVARYAFDGARDGLLARVDAAIAELHAASSRTDALIAELSARA